VILYKNGHYVSVQTSGEREEVLLRDLNNFSNAEQDILFELLETEGADRLIEALEWCEYERIPVSPEEWLDNPFYSGPAGQELYPRLRQDFIEFIGGDYSEGIFTGSQGWGKCSSVDTCVYDLTTGRRRRVGDIGRFDVATMGESGKIISGKGEAYKSGYKKCVKLILADGRSVVISLDHAVFTGRDGCWEWVQAKDLTADDLVAVPREMPEAHSYKVVTDEEIKLLAYLMANGGCTVGVKFTSMCPKVLAEVEACSNFFSGGAGVSKYKHGKATEMGLRGVVDRVRGWGIHGCKSTEKRMPDWTYGLPKRQVALLLNRFWACDGSVTAKTPQKVEMTLASEDLVDDIQFLLLRLGVRGRKAYKRSFYRKDGVRHEFDSWKLTVTGADNILRFLDEVGDLLGKEEVCQEARRACREVQSNSNTDVVPVGPGMPHHQVLDFDGDLVESRRWCEATGHKGRWGWLATSDLAWERVVEVRPVGMEEVYDLSVEETHNFIGNSIVLHNSFMTGILSGRLIYEQSCLRSPQRSFGLAQGTWIDYVCVNVNLGLARDVTLADIVQFIESSPYFHEVFPAQIQASRVRFTKKKMRISTKAAHDKSMLGLAVFGVAWDETNYVKDQRRSKARSPSNPYVNQRAGELYTTMKTRIATRFMQKGRMAGRLFSVSSKLTKSDFTEQRIRQAMHDSGVFVRDYAIYDVKPHVYSKKKFRVLLGRGRVPSRILKEGEEVDLSIYSEDDDAVILEVPEDFRPAYEHDLFDAARNHSGYSMDAISHYFRRREKVYEMEDSDYSHPASAERWVFGTPLEIFWDQLCKQNVYGDYRPITSPDEGRWFHIDQSRNRCASGICIMHRSGQVQVTRTNAKTGISVVEVAPLLRADFMLQVLPPPDGGEILLYELRRIIYQFIEHGYMFSGGSYDSYQSLGPKQELEDRGIKMEIMSTDRTTEPYDVARQASYEGRVKIYPYSPLTNELVGLEYDAVVGKVVFGEGGSKDVADPWACCVNGLTKTFIPHSPAVLLGADRGADFSWIIGG